MKYAHWIYKTLCWPVTVWRRYREYPQLQKKLRETEDRYESMLEMLNQRHADIVEDLYRRQSSTGKGE